MTRPMTIDPIESWNLLFAGLMKEQISAVKQKPIANKLARDIVTNVS